MAARESVILIIAALMSAGCGASAGTVVAPESGALAGELVDAAGSPAPQWVTAPATYRKDSDGLKVVCGKGSIGGTRNMNMAQSAAEGRARTALARSLETKVKAMIKDYQSTTTGGEQFGSAANDEQHVVDASKQITETTLSGTEVNETWISSKSTLHSLVCLNVERFKGVVSGMQQLDEQIRAAVVQRAERAWEELDDETEGGAKPSARAEPMFGRAPQNATTGYLPGTPSNHAEEGQLRDINSQMDNEHRPVVQPSATPSSGPGAGSAR